ncbi:MAG: hypothetical protein ACOZAQ_05565 [Pseudomonadota bacterium]
MDLLDFDAQPLYYDDPAPEVVWTLLEEAADGYAEGASDAPLARAEALAPESLAVLVALYRNHFYRHRLIEARAVAERALGVSALRLGCPRDWRALTPEWMAAFAAGEAMTLLRFHLMALKALAYLDLRLGQVGQGTALLEHLSGLDPKDRLGARALLDAVRPVPSST